MKEKLFLATAWKPYIGMYRWTAKYFFGCYFIFAKNKKQAGTILKSGLPSEDRVTKMELKRQQDNCEKYYYYTEIIELSRGDGRIRLPLFTSGNSSICIDKNIYKKTRLRRR
ncbi:MAG: hypothetical protein AAB696_00165 [Patescibacteria group bacterium]|mgnify:CR=1 FL=1